MIRFYLLWPFHSLRIAKVSLSKFGWKNGWIEEMPSIARWREKVEVCPLASDIARREWQTISLGAVSHMYHVVIPAFHRARSFALRSNSPCMLFRWARERDCIGVHSAGTERWKLAWKRADVRWSFLRDKWFTKEMELSPVSPARASGWHTPSNLTRVRSRHYSASPPRKRSLLWRLDGERSVYQMYPRHYIVHRYSCAYVCVCFYVRE